MRGVDECCFCGCAVLGLRGQDGNLPLHYLNRSAADDGDLIREGLGGACHLKCLAESAVAARWRARFDAAWSDYTQREFFRESAAGSVYWIPHLKEYRLLASDGWYATVGLHAFQNAIREGESYRLSTRSTLGTAHGLHDRLGRYADSQTPLVPIPPVLADLGIEGRQYDLTALRNGTIDITPMLPADRRPKPKKNRDDHIPAHHDIIVSSALYDLAWSIFENRPPVVR